MGVVRACERAYGRVRRRTTVFSTFVMYSSKLSGDSPATLESAMNILLVPTDHLMWTRERLGRRCNDGFTYSREGKSGFNTFPTLSFRLLLLYVTLS